MPPELIQCAETECSCTFESGEKNPQPFREADVINLFKARRKSLKFLMCRNNLRVAKTNAHSNHNRKKDRQRRSFSYQRKIDTMLYQSLHILSVLFQYKPGCIALIRHQERHSIDLDDYQHIQDLFRQFLTYRIL